jgi:hypothetical protein
MLTPPTSVFFYCLVDETYLIQCATKKKEKIHPGPHRIYVYIPGAVELSGGFKMPASGVRSSHALVLRKNTKLA